MPGKTADRMVRVIVAALAWFALALQFYLVLEPTLKEHRSLFGALESYFSFFTILTNLIVAITLTLSLSASGSRWGKWALLPQTRTAVAVYIAVVGIIYSLLLRATWNPQGWQKVADTILHDVVPIIYVLHWLIFVPKASLRWRETPLWLVYPAVYLIYILVRGAMLGRYPYPFIDLTAQSYESVGLNVVLIFLLFLFVSLAFVGIGRLGRMRAS